MPKPSTDPAVAETTVTNPSVSLGLFSAPGYISIGDKFEKKPPVTDRHKGKQLLTSPSKRGKVGKGVSFDEFKPLFQNEKYTDPGYFERQHKKEEKKKQLVDKPFKPSSPPKKSTGLGTYFGTIGKNYEHMVEYNVVSKNDKPKEIPHEKRNIMTSPPKRGTFGYSKLTIGKEFGYESDPYDAQRLKEMEEKKKNQSKRISQKAFKSMSKSLDYFDAYPNVAAPKILTIDKLAPETKKKPSQTIKNVSDKPFKPSSPPKSGYNCTLNKFPQHEHDPYEKNAITGDLAKERKNNPKEIKPVWKAVSPSHSTPCRSIIFGSKSLNVTM